MPSGRDVRNNGPSHVGVDAGVDQVLLDIRLVPHRSMTAGNVRVLIAVFALAGTISSLPFLLMGAWPVAGFMGLDVLLLYLAFRANFRAALAYEDIVLTLSNC